MNTQKSIFDAIAPIMIGPSSSHTAGAVRLGLLAKKIFNEPISEVNFKLYNSYAKTGFGHGTTKGLLAGTLGLAVDDERIKNIFNLEIAKELLYTFEYREDFNRHPNSVDFVIKNNNQIMTISGDSVGAGNICINKINDFPVVLDGTFNSLIINYKDVFGMISKVTDIIQKQRINIASLICNRSAKGATASMCICIDGTLDVKTLELIKNLDDIYFIRYIEKLDN